MRPTLAMTRGDGSGEVRALADLEGKPWAAFDGSEWRAAFPAEMTLEEAATAEMSVSPDITIALLAPDGGGVFAAGERLTASGTTSSPLAKSSPGRRRPSILGAGDADRVTARLAAAGDALQRERDRRTAAERALASERERRATSERALEEERAEHRRLQLELGQLRAELELARTGEAEAGEAATELEAVRQRLLAAERQIEEIGRERDRAARAHAETRTALNERTGALESARQALAAEQAETSRLRGELERRPAGSGTAAHATGDRASGRSATSRAARTSPSTREGTRSPAPAQGSEPELDPAPAASAADSAGAGETLPRRVSAVLRGADAPASHGPGSGGGAPPYHHPSTSESMRAHSPWFGRGLALLFLIGVVVAIVLVVQSTIH